MTKQCHSYHFIFIHPLYIVNCPLNVLFRIVREWVNGPLHFTYCFSNMNLHTVLFWRTDFTLQLESIRFMALITYAGNTGLKWNWIIISFKLCMQAKFYKEFTQSVCCLKLYIDLMTRHKKEGWQWLSG